MQENGRSNFDFAQCEAASIIMRDLKNIVCHLILNGKYNNMGHIGITCILKSLDGSNDPENLVDLWPKHHFLFHIALYVLFEGSEIAYAVAKMVNNTVLNLMMNETMMPVCFFGKVDKARKECCTSIWRHTDLT